MRGTGNGAPGELRRGRLEGQRENGCYWDGLVCGVLHGGGAGGMLRRRTRQTRPMTAEAESVEKWVSFRTSFRRDIDEEVSKQYQTEQLMSFEGRVQGCVAPDCRQQWNLSPSMKND